MARTMQGAEALKRRMAASAPAIRAALKKVLLRSAKDIEATAKRLVPRDTGELAQSITSGLGEPPPSRGIRIRTGGGRRGSAAGIPGDTNPIRAYAAAGDDKAIHAGWVEFGTAPGRKGDVTTNKRGQQRRVMRGHPGTPPRPFFLPAYRLVSKRAKNRIRSAIRRAIRDAAKGGQSK